MAADRPIAHWETLSGEVRDRRAKLSDNDFALIDGNRDELARILALRYGITANEAVRQVAEFERESKEAE